MDMNPVGWFEIYVDDMTRARAFYETVLGVKLEELEMPDTEPKPEAMWSFPMNQGGPGAGGALVKMSGMGPAKGQAGGTLIYFSCEDCGVEAARVESAGGTLQAPKMAIGPYGFCAMGVDTEGNAFGLHSMK